MKNIYELGLHERTETNEGLQITRVPGGWLYRYWDFEKQDYCASINFVSYNNEFDPTIPEPTDIPSNGESIDKEFEDRDCEDKEV